MTRPESLRAEAALCRDYAARIRLKVDQAEQVLAFMTGMDRALELDREAARLEAEADAPERRWYQWR